MLIGVALGVIVAIMRLSENPILRGVAWVYTWFFRAVPRLVLAILFGNLGILWARIEFGLPFDQQIGALFGIDDLERAAVQLRRGGHPDRLRRRHAGARACPRPRTWPRSSGPASSRSTRGRPRPPRRSA